MNSHKSILFLLSYLLLYSPLDASENIEKAANTETTHRLRVDDTSTEVHEELWTGRVTAIVHLKINELILKDGQFTGTYDIQVNVDDLPLLLRTIAGDKDESGTIHLPCDEPFEAITLNGKHLEGHGHCTTKENEKARTVICDVVPDPNDPSKGVLKLTIDSGKRIMNFTTGYTVPTREANSVAITD